MLRRDVHRLSIRAEEVDRQTKMVMGAIEEFVDRREALVDKAISLATSRQQNTTPQTIKSLLGKKIEDAKFKVLLTYKSLTQYIPSTVYNHYLVFSN